MVLRKPFIKKMLTIRVKAYEVIGQHSKFGPIRCLVTDGQFAYTFMQQNRNSIELKIIASTVFNMDILIKAGQTKPDQ